MTDRDRERVKAHMDPILVELKDAFARKAAGTPVVVGMAAAFCFAEEAYRLLLDISLEAGRSAIEWPDVAATLLGIDDAHAERLFRAWQQWPEPFRREYQNATDYGRAAVACRRIDHFIETGE